MLKRTCLCSRCWKNPVSVLGVEKNLSVYSRCWKEPVHLGGDEEGEWSGPEVLREGQDWHELQRWMHARPHFLPLQARVPCSNRDKVQVSVFCLAQHLLFSLSVCLPVLFLSLCASLCLCLSFKDRLPDRHLCLNLYPCIIKVQSINQSLYVCTFFHLPPSWLLLWCEIEFVQFHCDFFPISSSSLSFV